MLLILEETELAKLYELTKGLNSKEANKVFNSLFTADHIEMIEQTIISGKHQLQLNVDSDVSGIFLDAFIKNAHSISTLFSANKVSLLYTVKSVFDNLVKDIMTAVDVATKVWKRKHARHSFDDDFVQR